MGKLSRTKGHNFEREIAREFQEMGWDDAMTKRAARGGDWSTTDDGIDIVNVEPFAVQCKRYHDYVPIKTIEEIQWKQPQGIDAKKLLELQLRDDAIPLLITKADNKPTMAVLPWSELKKLIKASWGIR